MKTYKVNKVDDNDMDINGKGDHPLWEKAMLLKDFSSPWHHESVENIEFRALYDSENLYVSYKVKDDSLHIDRSDNSKKSVDNSDRVELFLRSDHHLDPYYCLEMDPLARVQDFIARPNRQFDFKWDWPKDGISLKSQITPTYFCVELALSLKSLIQFELIQPDGSIEAGIYRAKYNQQPNGLFEPTWITWVDPQTDRPDFHIASSFGKLQLEEY
ncbi:carbohydrate-binding family 9-like protein [Gelidibacter mesophilus]|uniref:carbohydrate-binding family 9-like protein n=1 Tax=Gelidibacter mesophilus TaxID=169050 RepID=UPI00047FE6C8|nr:carbohydrate-binding family 9-like protein [Gelidibacter mesophilus]